jgi:hypothetical protein
MIGFPLEPHGVRAVIDDADRTARNTAGDAGNTDRAAT